MRGSSGIYNMKTMGVRVKKAHEEEHRKGKTGW